MSVRQTKILDSLVWKDDRTKEEGTDENGMTYTLAFDGRELLVDKEGNHYDFKVVDGNKYQLTLDPYYTDKDLQFVTFVDRAMNESPLNVNIKTFAKSCIGKTYGYVYDALVNKTKDKLFTPSENIFNGLDHKSGNYTFQFAIERGGDIITKVIYIQHKKEIVYT